MGFFSGYLHRLMVRDRHRRGDFWPCRDRTDVRGDVSQEEIDALYRNGSALNPQYKKDGGQVTQAAESPLVKKTDLIQFGA